MCVVYMCMCDPVTLITLCPLESGLENPMVPVTAVLKMHADLVPLAVMSADALWSGCEYQEPLDASFTGSAND